MKLQEITAGHLFTYQETPRFLRRQLGVGQVLGNEDRHDIIFVRIFDVSGDELKPIIGLVPVTVAALEISAVQILKWVPLPHDWEALRDEWRRCGYVAKLERSQGHCVMSRAIHWKRQTACPVGVW
jgi:hypothetical protein